MAVTDNKEGSPFREMIGPTDIDSMIRNAVSMCWSVMPAETRTLQRVEAEIRRLVDRALKDMIEDAKAFGIDGMGADAR